MDKGTKGQISILFFSLAESFYNNLTVLTFSLCSLKSLFVSVYFDVEEIDTSYKLTSLRSK